MLNGVCPGCNSQTVYRKTNGISCSGNCSAYVKTSRWGSPSSDRITYVCTTCGLYQQFIADKGALAKVAQKWDKV